MTNEDVRLLCMSLIDAETDREVFELLAKTGYWEDPIAWRPVGDNENNKGIIGNQQEDAISALVEKLTNSIDAVLINQCLEAGIDPRSPDAPQTMREAISRFFSSAAFDGEDVGPRYWDPDLLSVKEVEALARNVWVSATGAKDAPSISIADRGEGQVPDSFPKTFMALIGFKNAQGGTESQKRDIPFVQGQFNMGSSGVYPYASRDNGFQLLVSRRNSALLASAHGPRDEQWGFTVVRRTKKMTGSVYEYLAPVPGDTNLGEVLSFTAPSLPLLPESPPTSVPNRVYATEVAYGTLVKLYEYRYKESGVGTSHILRKSGLMRQLELALPESGLPIRMVEGRDYKGKVGSFQYNMLGVVPRLDALANRGVDVEEVDDPDADEPSAGLGMEGAPVRGEMTLLGVRIPWNAYVFRENAGDRTRQGKYALLMQINGQKHAHQTTDFFKRKSVNYLYLGRNNTILVIVDCTGLSYLQREEVFKPSRDRLHASELSTELMNLLADSLKSNEQLRALQNQQHQRKQAERLTNKAPIRAVLESLLKSNPMLARFFKLGPDVHVSKPFKDNYGGSGIGGGKFVGKKHPSFIGFRNGESPKAQVANLGSRSRILLTTDAEDKYFSRTRYRGQFQARYLNCTEGISGNRGDLSGGAFAYSLTLPESAKVGDIYEVEFSLSDSVIPEPLTCQIAIEVTAPTQTGLGGKGKRRTSTGPGGNDGGRTMLNDMDILKCRKDATGYDDCIPWPDETWSDRTAVKVEENPETGGLTYFVNVDNIYLKDYQKQGISKDPALIEAKFMWALVFNALSLVEHYRKLDERKSEKDEINEAIEDDQSLTSRRDEDIELMTSAQAQLILPAMDAIAAMTSDLLEGD